ncbi:MAG: tetratricopeptide repeat protein [Candidatus Aminicenantes bacterium]|nr:tetratricopeptide repeat protein [Candidatus Aminicenantes bacterium]
MKKSLWTALSLLVLMAPFISAQSPADDDYIKAMQQTDGCQKIQLLKTWLGKYSGQGSQYEHFANAYVCLTPCATKNAAESIQYGEKALAMSGLDDGTKVQLMSTISALYTSLGQAGKAKAAAQQLIDLGQANKSKDPAQWTKIIGAGYYLQGQAAEKGKDWGGAAQAYIQSYGILKDPKITAQLKKIAKSLYDSKQYDAAEKIYREFYAAAKDPESAVILGQTLYKNGKTDEALAVFKEAYAKKKTGEIAYNIGIIVARQAQTDPAKATEAINTLLEASFLYPAQSQNAMNLAQSLFFTATKDVKYNALVTKINEHNKAIEEYTKTYNSKIEGKSEDDLSANDKQIMQKLLDAIEVEKQAIKKIEAEQQVYVDRFNQLVAQAKARVGK